MADHTKSSTVEELRCAVRDKEHELSELDLMLADYHAEHCRLIRELGRLRAQLRDAEEADSAFPGPPPK